jgi:hypothetical protein
MHFLAAAVATEREDSSGRYDEQTIRAVVLSNELFAGGNSNLPRRRLDDAELSFRQAGKKRAGS